MNEDFKIQRASVNEVNLIADIKTRAYRDEKERFKPCEDKIPKWFYDEWYIDISENLRLINEYYVYVLVSNEKMIGTFWLHDIDEETIELEDFCILPEFQGLGMVIEHYLLWKIFFQTRKSGFYQLLLIV